MKITKIANALIKAHGQKGALHYATYTAANFEGIYARTKSAHARSMADNWTEIRNFIADIYGKVA